MTEPVASCTLTREGAEVDVPVGVALSVVYEFNTSATNGDLALRYLVLIDGKVLPQFAKSPGVLGKTDRKIKVRAAPGNEVALILNSDVHPKFRSHPVYAVRVRTNDVLVRIAEKLGRHNHIRAVLDCPVLRESGAPGKRIDSYEAFLTGDIWMEISHRYTSEEAQAVLPQDMEPIVRAAVLSIYQGLPRPELILEFPVNDSRPRRTMRVNFPEVQNVLANITYCSHTAEVLPRTHPLAYAALLSSAAAANITAIVVTSGWRPLLGSITHRAGLGLDVGLIANPAQRVKLDRTTLFGSGASSSVNVSGKEKSLYTSYEAAKAALAELKRERERMTKNSNTSPQELYALDRKIDSQEEKVKKAKTEWNSERDANEAPVMRELRMHLESDKAVTQILDPWYMDTNTRDKIPPVPNEQLNALEKLHATHLHITVSETSIL